MTEEREFRKLEMEKASIQGQVKAISEPVGKVQIFQNLEISSTQQTCVRGACLPNSWGREQDFSKI